MPNVSVSKILGPYGEYKTLILYYSDGACRKILQARYIYSEYLGRPLMDNEHVHYIDGNRHNLAISNLKLAGKRFRVKSRGDTKHICPTCNKTFSITSQQYSKHLACAYDSGPYCSRYCSNRRYKRS